MRKIIALLLLVAFVSAAGINFTEPSGTYGYGAIPVSLEFTGNGTITLQLVKDGLVLKTKTIGEPYAASFEVLNRGTYEIRASAEYNETTYENSTTFEVNSSKIYITVLAPKNQTYSGTIPLEVVPQQDNSFLHKADVTVTVGGKSYTLPEGQNSYRSEASLTAGIYTAVIDVNGETAEVSFTVAGKATEGNETIYLPGLGKMEIKRISPSRAGYVPGDSVDIAVYLLNQNAQRVSGATAEAIVKSPGGLRREIPLQEMTISGKPVYKISYTFSRDGFYEVMVSAAKEGYENASLYMPPIKVGEEAPQLPEDVFCRQGICIRVESPSETETYPDGSTVGLRVQLVEEQAVSPIAGANVTASWGNTTQTLAYDWNGYYYNTSGNMDKGDYLITFHAESNGKSVEKNSTLHISPDQLVISAINPVPGGNVTTDFTTVQVKITDQAGEIVTDADIRAIITTPLTGTRTVPLSRNTATGYYEAEYTFANSGQYTLKIVASKIGYVSSEALYTIEVAKTPESIRLTEQDVVIGALIIGVLIVIATLWKALL